MKLFFFQTPAVFATLSPLAFPPSPDPSTLFLSLRVHVLSSLPSGLPSRRVAAKLFSSPIFRSAFPSAAHTPFRETSDSSFSPRPSSSLLVFFSRFLHYFWCVSRALFRDDVSQGRGPKAKVPTSTLENSSFYVFLEAGCNIL